MKSEHKGWIGVDLDKTLAKYSGWKGDTVIGDVIPQMANRVRKWSAQGQEVRVMTSRASQKAAVGAIKKWLAKNKLPAMKVTNKKDHDMIRLYDDRAVQVEPNTGRLIGAK